MEMEEITHADSRADDRDEEESTEIKVHEPTEGENEEETNINSKLQNPSEDVYQMASLVTESQKQQTNLTRFRLFRAVTAVLSAVCLILLVVIIALAAKLQTQPVCSEQDRLKEKMDASVCSVEQCMSVFPPKQRVPTPTSVSASESCLTCGKGWIEFESFCFFLSRERHTWSESRVECQNRGGDLAVLDQDGVKNFLSQKSKDLYWIGLNRSPSGVWTWVDGSALGKSNWSEQPGQADCVYVDGEGDQSWSTSKCSSVTFYICQKSFC